MSERRISLDEVANDFYGFVRRIVENLNVQLVLGIFQPADAVDQPVRDILLVEHRQLHGDARKIFKAGRGFGGSLVPVLVIKIDKDVAVHAVRCQQDQDDEVGNQQADVESVGVVEALECPVEKVLADVGPDAFWGGIGGQ